MTQQIPMGTVTIEERPTAIAVRGPQLPPTKLELIPPRLRELLRERNTLDERATQAVDLHLYLMEIATNLNFLFQCLVYSMGEIKRQQLYRDIGHAALGPDVEITSIESLCVNVLKIDPRLAKQAETTYETVTPFLLEVGFKPDEITETFADLDPIKAGHLQSLATQSKVAKKHRQGPLDDTMKQEFQAEVANVMDGHKPSADYSRGRHEDIEPVVIDFDWEVIEPGDSEPYIVLRERKLFMRHILAWDVHRAGFKPSDMTTGLPAEPAIVRDALNTAFNRWGAKKGIPGLANDEF